MISPAWPGLSPTWVACTGCEVSLDRAVILCQEALALFEALGDAIELPRTPRTTLGLIYLDQGVLGAKHVPHLTQSRALLQQVGDRSSDWPRRCRTWACFTNLWAS